MTIPEILEHRHDYWVEWQEPWAACGPQGNLLDAFMVVRTSVHDAINLSRIAAKQAGRDLMGDDGKHLEEFLIVHWATILRNPTSEHIPIE